MWGMRSVMYRDAMEIDTGSAAEVSLKPSASEKSERAWKNGGGD